MARQCELLGVARSSWYYQPVGESAETLALLRLLDEQYTRTPFYGVRRMTAWLRSQGHVVNRKRVRRLLRLLGGEAIYPKPSTSTPAPGHRLYPYLLRDVPITHVDQVWSSDSTYIRLERGWLYLVAILDWYSRYVLAWEVSNTLDSDFCVAALDRALARGRPATGSILTCCAGCRSPTPTRSGVATSPTSAWSAAGSTWSRSWTGTAATS